ncbi:MAG: hypothetical protein RLZZ546_1792, partial [Bacteroidota bacterium]
DTLKFCEGESIESNPVYQVIASDDDPQDNLSFSIDAPYDSWFLISGKNIRLKRKFSISDIGTHRIVINVKDDHCPSPTSTTKILYIKVEGIPYFDLGLNYAIKCNEPKTLSPTFFTNQNTSKYKYQWNSYIPSGSQYAFFKSVKTPSFSPDYISLNFLTVTTDLGCKYKDSVYATSDLSITSIFTSGECFVEGTNHTTTYFGPLENSFSSGKIVKYEWLFNPGNITSTDRDLKVLISEMGTYKVNLRVTNEFGCTYDFVYFDNVCQKQEAGFDFSDSLCSGMDFVFVDTTDYDKPCDDKLSQSGKVEWNLGDGIVKSGIGRGSIKHTYTKGGIYDVTMISMGDHFCKDTIVKKVKVFQRPEISILQEDSLDIICNNPDTALLAQKIISGTGEHNFLWQHKMKGQIKNFQSGTDSSAIVSDTGFYYVTVIDSAGCIDRDTVYIKQATEVAFEYTPTCILGDTMVLFDKSTSNTPIIERSWTISKGTSQIATSTDAVFNFHTDIPDLYSLKFKVTDENGCKDSLKAELSYLFAEKDSFSIDTLISICATDLVNVNSFGNKSGFKNVSSSKWYLGTGDTLKTTPGKYQLSFPKEGTYSLYHQVVYNVDTNSRGFCTMDTLVKVRVKPEFKIEALYKRLCLYDSAYFELDKVVGDPNIPIIFNEWILTNAKYDVYDTINKQSFRYIIEYPETYSIKLTAIDSNKCVAKQNLDKLTSSTLSKPSIEFLSKGICANKIGDIEATVVQDFKVENISNYYLVINNDTVVSGVGNPRVLNIPYQFQGTRSNRATIYLIDKKEQNSSQRYLNDADNSCRASKAIDIYLLELPELEVETDTVCPKNIVTITNKSNATPFSGNIIEYKMKLDNEFVTYPKDVKNWKKTYLEGGFKDFELIGKTDSGCVDTLKGKFFVKPSPKADFEIEQRFPEAFIPLTINDVSVPSAGFADNNATIDSSFYDLGDGTTETGLNLTHTYDSVKTYMVKHWVENNYGCRDTIIKPLDMKPYLDVPNAFSPNGDGNNDQLGLIYKSIIK